MNYRNAQRLENGWIDCEINHPDYGWIPYTLNPKDTDMTVNNDDLLAAMVANGNVAPYIPPTQEELDAIAAQALAYARSRMVASAFQTREALDLVGKLDAVEAAILQADATTKRAWTYATEFRRGSPTIATMATALSLTDEDVDALFTLAMSIEV